MLIHFLFLVVFNFFVNLFYILDKEYMTSLEEEQSNNGDSLCVKVNKSHHTTITAWQSPKSDNSKEVVLYKEIEMSDTYRFVKTNQDINLKSSKHIDEDNDSFCGSDLETDDVEPFSGDERQDDKYDDSSSSDEEQTKVLKYESLLYIIYFVVY